MHIISDNIVSLIQKLIQYTCKSPNRTSRLEGTPHNHCSVILIKHYTEHFLKKKISYYLLYLRRHQHKRLFPYWCSHPQQIKLKQTPLYLFALSGIVLSMLQESNCTALRIRTSINGFGDRYPTIRLKLFNYIITVKSTYS